MMAAATARPVSLGEFVYRTFLPCLDAFRAGKDVRRQEAEALKRHVLPRLGDRGLAELAEGGLESFAANGRSEQGQNALRHVFMLAETLGFIGLAEGKAEKANPIPGGTVRKRAREKAEAMGFEAAKTLDVGELGLDLPFALTQGALEGI